MSKTSMTLFGCFGVFVYIIALIVVGSIFNGWAASILWQWFIMPLFEVQKISIAQAIGLGLAVRTITSYTTTTTKPQEGDLFEKCMTALAHTILVPAIAVGIGWIVLQFM